MVKPIVLVLAAIPGIVAALIAVPMLTQTEIPFSAATTNDRLELEYTRHHLKAVSFGITEGVGAQKSEVLKIKGDGKSTYITVDDISGTVERDFELDEQQMLRLTAFIKETGIMSIPADQFTVRGGATDYQMSVLKATLNGNHAQLKWLDQNATDNFVPPILTQLEEELDGIISDRVGE